MNLSQPIEAFGRKALHRARQAGLPVDGAEQLFADSIRPRLVQLLSPRVMVKEKEMLQKASQMDFNQVARVARVSLEH